MSTFHDDLEKAAFIASLKNSGIVTLVAEYDGGGDSGSINTVYCEDAAGNKVSVDIVVENTVEEMLYDVLSTNYDYDWYNNEGGWGTITINLEEQTWNVDGAVRITEDACQSGDYGTSN